jgi:hypothetical protein
MDSSGDGGMTLRTLGTGPSAQQQSEAGVQIVRKRFELLEPLNDLTIWNRGTIGTTGTV